MLTSNFKEWYNFMVRDFIWTNHALKRLKDRKIPKDQVLQALYNFDQKHINSDGSIELRKKISNQTVAAIIKENERGEKIIVSCWINPPNYGTFDHRKKERYFKGKYSSFLKKLWFTFLNQIGA